MTESKTGRPIRVVVTKVGLDGHDRGVKVIAQALRDAGMEVVYAGLRRTPEEIARIVLEEDADVLGLSILSGAVVPLTRRTREALAAQGLDDVLLVVGTSAVVHPAASLIPISKRGRSPGAKVIEINLTETEASRLADVGLYGPSGQVLPKLVEKLGM